MARISLQATYDELHGKLSTHTPALRVFLGLVLSTAAFWNPERIANARAARDELDKLNGMIEKRALELAELLDQRSDLHDTSGFATDTHYHVCHVIESASRENSLFKWHVQEKLKALHSQFDLKYWPSLSNFLQELADDARKATPEASDPLTEAATTARRPSLADFFKALFAAIEENSARQYGLLPREFSLSDNAYASLVNAALDLDDNELVDSAYVKRLRQRLREGA